MSPGDIATRNIDPVWNIVVWHSATCNNAAIWNIAIYSVAIWNSCHMEFLPLGTLPYHTFLPYGALSHAASYLGGTVTWLNKHRNY